MKLTLEKSGNSLALRIPKALAKQIKVHEGTEVELTVRAGALVARAASQRYVLSELLKKVTPQNVHAEFDWESPHDC